MPRAETPRILVITGPTASGKGAVAFELAQRLGAEIVSVDSVKIYRGMDVGAGKPSAEKRQAVRYHLIDIVEPTEVYNMGRYVADATAALADIARRGKRAILVGGTAMYLKGLLKGVFEGPPADLALRQKLRDLALEKGTSHLHRRLREVDPVAAERLHPNDLKRIMRALEVFEQTGQRISGLQGQWTAAGERFEYEMIGLRRDKAELHDRIGRRADAMFANGLVDEVRALPARYGQLSREAARAVGYREVMAHLDGRCGLDEAKDLVKLHTRQFAKRQMTWFRSFEELRWLDVVEPEDAKRTADRILAGKD